MSRSNLHNMYLRPLQSSGLGALSNFNPASIFGASDVGVYYAPYILTSMLQERTGASAATASGVDGVIGSLVDLSGNNNYGIAPSDAARPILRQSGSLYYIDADGVDDRLLTTPLATLGSTWSHVGAWARTSGNNDWVFSTRNEYRSALRVGTTDQVIWYIDGGGANTLTANTTTGGVITVERTANTAIDGRLNGVAGATRVPYDDSATADGLTLFAERQSGGSGFFDGGFYGGIWIDRALTSAERSNLETYFAAKAGITL